MSDYDIALEIDPNNFIGHYNRGLLRAQVGDDNRAIEDFDFVINMEPDNMMAIFNRGLLRDQTGDYKGAIKDYSTVINEYPNFVIGYQYRAQARKKVGDIKTGKFNEFSFDTVTRCRGKAYKVVFEKDSIALYTEKTSEKGTNLKINSEESEGTLILKTVTYRFDIETFYVFLLLVLYICVFFQFLNWLFSR